MCASHNVGLDFAGDPNRVMLGLWLQLPWRRFAFGQCTCHNKRKFCVT